GMSEVRRRKSEGRRQKTRPRDSSAVLQGSETSAPLVWPRKHLLCVLPPGLRSLLQYPHRRIAAWRAHDSAARMRGRSAHVKVANRRLVLRPAWRRTEEEKLLERQLALEDVSFRQAESALDIERRQHLTMQDDVSDVRRVFGERVDDRVAERLAAFVPV